MRRVLAFGKSPGMVERGLALLRNAGWEAVGVLTADAALQRLGAGTFNLLIIGGGVGKAERLAVERGIARLAHPPRIIRVHGVANLQALLRVALAQP